MKQRLAFFITLISYNIFFSVCAAQSDTLLHTRQQITQLILSLNILPNDAWNKKIAYITQQFIDKPYAGTHAMGEGDWQPKAWFYQPGARHISQDPVYQMDAFNCQTFVQMVLALFHSHTLNEFDKNYLKIAYGAAGSPNGNIVQYLNRNHFIEADFNPINEKNGFLINATALPPLAQYKKSITANITRQQWVNYQPNHSKIMHMLNHVKSLYTQFLNKKFNFETVTIDYLPKELLAIQQADGSYLPNQLLLNQLPTPAVAEIIRNPRQWNFYGIPIKQIIGTELAVSHLGLLYRQQFHHGELIYQHTTCARRYDGQKVCEVTPIYCQQATCHELMFAHATDALPKNFYWYRMKDGEFTCAANKPQDHTPYTHCNRIVSLPFFDYLTEYHFGNYWNMALRSIVGVHLEKIV